MNKIKKLFLKYKSLIMYAFFGVCTTLVNWVSYYLLYNIANIPNVPSTVIALRLSPINYGFLTADPSSAKS